MASVLAVRKECRLQEWAQIQRRCKESGLSNREFCLKNGISEKTYYYRLRKLREAAASSQPQLVALNEARKIKDDIIHIRYGDAVIDLPGRTDTAAIAALLEALQKL